MCYQGKTMALDVATAGRRTFSALPEDQALVYAKKMTTHSVLSFQERLQYPGYNDVEVHYVLCENDEIIPPELQQGMIEMIKTTSGREPTVHKVKGDHVPDISQRDMMTNIVKGIVA